MVDANTEFDMTPAQLRMWAGQQMHPDAPLYNMALSYRISGALEPLRFAAAFDKLIAEADALRMVVVEAGERPSLRVLPTISATLRQVDLTSEPEPATAATEWMQKQCGLKFDLTSRNFDSALLRLGDADWIWYFNQHHMFTDASSFAVLFQRLSELYLADRGGTAGQNLPKFQTFITTPKTHQQAEAARQHFAATNSVLPRLYGRRTGGGETRSKRMRVGFSQAQAKKLRARAMERPWAALTPQMSQYNMIATVLYAFLFRIIDQTSIAIGAPVHNRATSDARRMAGMLIDVLPMSVEFDPDDSFVSLFDKVRRETGLLLRYASSAQQDGSLQRRFNVVLNYITAQFGAFSDMPTEAEWLHCGHCDAQHHLRLQVEDFNKTDELHLFLDLNCGVFPEPEATTAHFSSVFEAFLSDPDQPISGVSLASPAELAKIDAFGTGPSTALEQLPVPDLIAGQSARTPQAIAISHCRSKITYAELDNRVTDLCAALQACGVKHHDRVALILPRSPAAVVAMIAVMRCGAAFVPVDPKNPPERSRFIIEDSDCAAVVACDAEIMDALVIAEDGQLQDKTDATFAPVAVTPENTAYILYTSGSTGKPKGVILPHRGLSHYIGWARDTYCPDRQLTFPLFSPLTFDLTMTSIFVPLVSGGTIRIFRETDDSIDTALLDIVSEDFVDIIKLTPSHLRLLIGLDLSASRVRQLIVGGEDFPVDLAHDIHATFGGNVSIHNEYGPTEATVGCILHTFDPEKDLSGSVPIGRPIANMKARILNAHGQPQLPGVAGELVLSGAGIADGYHKRPDLTAQAFQEAPNDGSRTYSTGDLAVFRQDGTIDYLGRIDQQVKVNGVRIETGEIEAVLTALSGIDTACVVLNQKPRVQEDPKYCVACGLPSNFPDIDFNDKDLCSICQEFARYKDSAQDYFQGMPQLQAILDSRLPGSGSHDCVVLFSGGKDSTYMLGQLADMGLNVLAFTLDNGFISDQAKANIDRVVTKLGVDHVYKTVDGMNKIFADSLQRHANVCNGCFKTIYTLGTQLANERNIPFVFTGLSRGQFFETRLSPEVFGAEAPNAADIDEMVLEARKIYHRTNDAVAECLDVSAFRSDEIFERVQVVDFYRYCDVNLDELYGYLDARLPWVRPSDTGRSTNCLINDVGIYVHKTERGFHNYALPYSWDVRMGHKKRDAALAELDDNIDLNEVENILAEIGYRIPEKETPPAELIAYYTGSEVRDDAELRAELAKKLPSYMVPAQFIHLNELPLSRNGKIDRAALPAPQQSAQYGDEQLAPRTEAERRMATIWEEVLGIAPVGVEENFFNLGGDSVAAIRINTRALQAGFDLRPNDIFEALTIARLVELAGQRVPEIEGEVAPGPLPLMPAQSWFLGDREKMPPVETQMITVTTGQAIEPNNLLSALREVTVHHDALRTMFNRQSSGWSARLLAEAPDPVVLQIEDAPDEAFLNKLNLQINASHGQNIAAAIKEITTGTEITIAAHHLVIDASSWPILLQDLGACLRNNDLPSKTTSIRRWATELLAIDDDTATHWKDYLQDSTTNVPMLTLPTGTEQIANLTRTSVSISASELDHIRAALRARGGSLTHAVLTALALALADRESPGKLQIAVEGNGRAAPNGRLNASRTIGWFTAFEPFVLPIPNNASSSDPLQILQSISRSEESRPANAAAADVLQQRNALPLAKPELVLNILDEIDLEGGIFRVTKPLRLWQDPTAPVRNALTVNATIQREGLSVEISGLFDSAALDKFAQDLSEAFKRLHHALPRTATHTKTKATNKSNLDKLAALIGTKGGH